MTTSNRRPNAPVLRRGTLYKWWFFTAAIGVAIFFLIIMAAASNDSSSGDGDMDSLAPLLFVILTGFVWAGGIVVGEIAALVLRLFSHPRR